MNALLVICTKEQGRAVILFYTDGVEGRFAQKNVSAVWEQCRIAADFCEMIESFKNARTSVKYEEGAGRLSAYITDANTERVSDMILRNRLVIIDEVARQLQISHDSAYEIIHNRHAFQNV